MSAGAEASHVRTVRLWLHDVLVEGRLLVPGPTRTLDELNRRGSRLLRLVEARWFPRHGVDSGESPAWRDVRRMAVRKESIVFVEETGSPPSSTAAGEAYARAPIHLELGELVAQGYLHVPRGGDPLSRLDASEGPTFIAMTSVSAVGEDVRLTVPFLAINRQQVVLAYGLAPQAREAERATAVALASDE